MFTTAKGGWRARQVLFTSEAACECSCAGGGLVLRWLMHVSVCVCLLLSRCFITNIRASCTSIHYYYYYLLNVTIAIVLVPIRQHPLKMPQPHPHPTPPSLFFCYPSLSRRLHSKLVLWEFRKRGESTGESGNPRRVFYFCVCEGAKSLTLSPGLLPAASRRKTGWEVRCSSQWRAHSSSFNPLSV